MESKDILFIVVMLVVIGYWLHSNSTKWHAYFINAISLVGIVFFVCMWVWGIGYLIFGSTTGT